MPRRADSSASRVALSCWHRSRARARAVTSSRSSGSYIWPDSIFWRSVGTAKERINRPTEERHDVELGSGDRLYRQPAALLDHQHVPEALRGFQGLQRDDGREALDEGHVHHVPRRRFQGGGRIEVLVTLLPGEVIRIGGARDRREAGDAGGIGVRRVEQHAVALLHLVAHEVPRLVVANAFPARTSVALEVVDRVGAGLAFHQPVASGHTSSWHAACLSSPFPSTPAFRTSARRSIVIAR